MRFDFFSPAKYYSTMFVAVACDFSNPDHRDTICDLMLQYGFKKVMGSLFESAEIDETTLARIKKDIDRHTDSYDTIRIYQYPMENTLVVTSLENKKWVKLRIVV
jgi:CRISPR-associated protein Cas2